MDPIKNVREILQPAIQDTGSVETTQKPASSESRDALETAQPNIFTDIQNAFAGNLDSDFDSMQASLNDVDSKLKDVDSYADAIKNDLDSMSEMGETESLRLQMAMDRMSKMMTTLSNIMKKIEGTADNIAKNLK
jgi:septation ring formation regulator EzrA